MSQAAWVLVAVLVLATGFGLWRLATDGRFRGSRRIRSVPDVTVGAASGDTGPDRTTVPGAGVREAIGLDHELGERFTLLQFSSAFCAPCRATRRVLGEVAEVVPGVRHVEIDAEEHLDLVRRLNILRTPTTLILDGNGRERSRATGATTKGQVLGVLGSLAD